MPLATRAAGVRRIRTECANPSSRPALPQRAIRDTASALAAPDARYSHENDERAPRHERHAEAEHDPGAAQSESDDGDEVVERERVALGRAGGRCGFVLRVGCLGAVRHVHPSPLLAPRSLFVQGDPLPYGDRLQYHTQFSMMSVSDG